MKTTAYWCSALMAVVLLAAAANAQGLIGALYVSTDPSEAAIYVNGELRGISPCGIPDVPAGQVEVRAEKQGWAVATENVVVEEDETTRVSLSLQKLANVGSIAVLVDPPGSKIRVDRVPAGRTPAVLLNARAGTHRVVVEADGFRPLHSTVTVVPNEQFVLSGKLTSLTAPSRQTAAGLDLDKLGELDLDSVPATAQMPEERALEAVRKLLSKRHYNEALRKLDEMAADKETRKYIQRIALVRRLARRMQRIVKQSHQELQNAKGREHALALRKGIKFTGTLADVTDTHVVIMSEGGATPLPLGSISAEQVVRLASRQLRPDRRANRIGFAVLYAAEGEFDKAYEQLRTAAQEGEDITEARSYVDAEHLWAAAVQKEETERLLARVSGRGPRPRLQEAAGPIRLVLDTYRGEELSAELNAMLLRSGFAIQPLSEPFSARDAEQAALLVIRDPGPTRAVPAYDRQEIQLTIDFVRSGGGLVFFGRPRAGPQQPNPFGPLLQWCGIRVRADVLSVSEEAPDDYPSEQALCFPVARHPVTYDVRRVVLPLSSPSLSVDGPAAVLLRTDRLVGSKMAGEAAPAVAAARILGNGRVVVFANLPLLQRSPWGRSPFYANDAEQVLLNGLLWAARPVE